MLTQEEISQLEPFTEKMGDELGKVAFLLRRHTVELHVVWQQYRQLYGSDDGTIELLNQTAGLFFMVVQDQLWDSVVIAILRLNDPKKTLGKSNLTIMQLPELIREKGDHLFAAEIETLCTASLATTNAAKDRRNRQIAHHDYELAMGQTVKPLDGISREMVEQMLSALRDVLHRVMDHYLETHFLFQPTLRRGATQLVDALRRLERYDATKSAN